MRKIIFDLDGTLLFLSDKWLEMGDDLASKYQTDIPVKELFYVISQVEKDNPDKYITKEFLIDYINSKLPLGLGQRELEMLLEEYAKIPLLDVDAVKNTLSYLSDKYDLVAYTNWFTDNQILRLKLNGLDGYFKKVFGWDVLPTKPSKKGLDEIMGGDDVKDYVFVGDSIEMDLELPDSIGMETILLNRKNIIQDKYREIRNISELEGLL